MTQSSPASDLSPPEVLSACLYDQREPKHNVLSIYHRQQVIKSWGIPAGSKVLEIGPGQGDFTVALADAVGPMGRVVAVDPAPLDYGTPDLATAQAFIRASSLGPRIEFVQADPVEYLSSTSGTVSSFDFVIFGHCIWFFSHPSLLPRMMKSAHDFSRARSIFIAEYSLSASIPAQVPHLPTALTYNAIESFRGDDSLRNIRSALSPRQMTRAAIGSGWALVNETLITPGPKQLEGWREVKMLRGTKFFSDDLESVTGKVDEKVKAILYSMTDAVVSSVNGLEGGLTAVRNMDVWVARFELSNVATGNVDV